MLDNTASDVNEL